VAPRLAAHLAARKTPAAAARAEAIVGRVTCAGKRTRSIFQASFHWHREFSLVLTTPAVRRRDSVVDAGSVPPVWERDAFVYSKRNQRAVVSSKSPSSFSAVSMLMMK